jgi:O-antigen/teichoic acid export membrane protein
MGVAFIPVYLRYIGAEGYGLVGFFAMISSVLTILDGGFGAAAARELSKTHKGDESARLNDLIRSLEWAFWGLALLLGIGLVVLAPHIANGWLRIQQIQNDEARDALRLMGIALILQWPAAYYRGCIIGLQRQVGLNAIGAALATLRGAGAVLVLWLISPSIRAFFAWQIIAAFLNVSVLRWYLWNSMPVSTQAPRFRISSIRTVGRFAAGVGVTNILALILTQLDKILLSKILPLSQFGYYTLAAAVSGLIYQFIGPVFNAFYPRITQVVSHGREADVALLYHQASQTMALSIVPISLLMVFFARDMVWVWTDNAQLAATIRWVVACLAIGTMFNGLITIPYALQLANAWTMLTFWQNIVAVTLLAPLIYIFATRFGLIGAATVWPILNFGYVALGAPIMYRRLLSAEMRRWYLYSIFTPIAITAGIMGVSKLLLDRGSDLTKQQAVIAVACVFLVSVPVTGWFMPDIRQRLFNRRRMQS